MSFLGLKWIMNWSPQARIAWKNVENSKKLRVGMTTREMLDIMGEAKSYKQKKYNGDIITRYYYQPPFAASSGINIDIVNDSINFINYYEGT